METLGLRKAQKTVHHLALLRIVSSGSGHKYSQSNALALSRPRVEAHQYACSDTSLERCCIPLLHRLRRVTTSLLVLTLHSYRIEKEAIVALLLYRNGIGKDQKDSTGLT